MKEKIRKVLEKAIKSKEPFDVLVPETEAFGHYSTNLALRLAKKLIGFIRRGIKRRVKRCALSRVKLWELLI